MTPWLYRHGEQTPSVCGSLQVSVTFSSLFWSQHVENTRQPFQVTGSHWLISILIVCQLPSTKWPRDNVNNYWLEGRVRHVEEKTTQMFSSGVAILYHYFSLM